MRVLIALTTCLLLASGTSAQTSPGVEAIKRVLTNPKGWSVFAEYTQSSTPTENATKMGWRFYRAGTMVKGRTTRMAEEYNCDFDIVLRDDGFEVSTRARWCTPGTETIMTPLFYDAADKAYPFKNLSNPLKWWIAPQP